MKATEGMVKSKVRTEYEARIGSVKKSLDNDDFDWSKSYLALHEIMMDMLEKRVNFSKEMRQECGEIVRAFARHPSADILRMRAHLDMGGLMGSQLPFGSYHWMSEGIRENPMIPIWWDFGDPLFVRVAMNQTFKTLRLIVMKCIGILYLSSCSKTMERICISRLDAMGPRLGGIGCEVFLSRIIDLVGQNGPTSDPAQVSDDADKIVCTSLDITHWLESKDFTRMIQCCRIFLDNFKEVQPLPLWLDSMVPHEEQAI